MEGVMRTYSQVELQHARVLDGGLATELERRGVNIGGPLWSARALSEAPEAILAVHRSYLDAGAQVLLTASYQVSARGFHTMGMVEAEAVEEEATALRAAVNLALAARAGAGLSQVLIAGSLGPYGAALANGAEFHGNYGFADERAQHRALVGFHERRIAVLAETDADLLAFETLPSIAEAQAIVEALAAWPNVGAWLSFTCRDGERTAHGELLRECAALLDGVPQVLAIGVNCTAPGLILPLIGELRAGTQKPLVVYPNSGEGWDAESRCWTGTADVEGYAAMAASWFAAGAQLVGGCCRTGPEHVRAVAQAAGLAQHSPRQNA
jgi:homocysteine S-methyltransferase